MSEYFPSQVPNILVGSKVESTGALTAVALTDAYDVANKTKIIKTAGFVKVTLDGVYTVGSTETNNSLLVRLEGSSDGVNFYQLSNEAATAGSSVITQREISFVGAAAGAYKISLLLDIGYRYMRFSFKESGVVTNAGTLYAECTLSGK